MERWVTGGLLMGLNKQCYVWGPLVWPDGWGGQWGVCFLEMVRAARSCSCWFELLRAVWDCLGLFWAAWSCLGLLGAAWGYLVLFGAVCGSKSCSGLF